MQHVNIIWEAVEQFRDSTATTPIAAAKHFCVPYYVKFTVPKGTLDVRGITKNILWIYAPKTEDGEE